MDGEQRGRGFLFLFCEIMSDFVDGRDRRVRRLPVRSMFTRFEDFADEIEILIFLVTRFGCY